MDVVEVAGATASPNNLSSGDWWVDTEDENALALPLDASEGGLFSGNFVPPPPRPLFLDEAITPDGLTTCDLCSWAWEKGNAFSLDTGIENPGELGWVLTLVIVSLISALLGAIIMITVLHCKRMKNSNANDSSQTGVQRSQRPPINTPDDKTISTITPANFPHGAAPHHAAANNGVWSWLSRRGATTPSQLDSPTSPAENHYTHMDETYNGVGEALYAELDRESTSTVDINSPAYQNGAYTDPDAPSAPSSAYYSDLSVTTMPERAYEVVGLSTLPMWNPGGHDKGPRLASISETVSVPSDYV